MLFFSDAPVFLTRPSPTAGMPGERVTLRCKVDSNPPPVYTWTRLSDDTAAGSNPTLSHSANLTFVAGDATAGVYECSASASGHPAVASRAAVRVKGPPSIVDTPAVQWAALGQNGPHRLFASAVGGGDRIKPSVEFVFSGQRRNAERRQNGRTRSVGHFMRHR